MSGIRWRRALLVAAVLAVVLVVIGVGLAHRSDRAVAENAARAERLKVAIDRRFPPGTSEASVVPALKRDYPGHVVWPGAKATEYVVPVGDEPSDVWYCGSWTRGVKLRFESRRLVSTAVERWSTNCM
jgi:hypothetical protein